MTRKGYRTVVIEDRFAQMAENRAVKNKRSLSNQIEIDIEACNK